MIAQSVRTCRVEVANHVAMLERSDYTVSDVQQLHSSTTTRRMHAEHDIEKVGAKLRDMMPWIKEKAMVDKTKN